MELQGGSNEVQSTAAVVSLLSFGASLAIAQDRFGSNLKVVQRRRNACQAEVSVTARSTGTLEVADVGHLAIHTNSSGFRRHKPRV
jgi:hypothetical protein